MAPESGRSCLVPPLEKAKKNSNGTKVYESKFKKEWIKEFPASPVNGNEYAFIAYLVKRTSLVVIKFLAMSNGI